MLRAVALISSLVVPGSGFVIIGKPIRGLMYLVWIIFFGCITFKLTSPEVSLIGRFSGGLAVWTLSLLELYRLLGPGSDRVRRRDRE